MLDKTRVVRLKVKWMAPQKGWVKFNIDGVSFGNPRKASIGGLLRDHKGSIKVKYLKDIEKTLTSEEEGDWFVYEVELQGGSILRRRLKDPGLLISSDMVVKEFISSKKRKSKWKTKEVKQIMGGSRVIWVLRGDFNAIKREEERIGKGNISRTAKRFDEFINEVGLMDLSMVGGRFTWSNNRKGITFSLIDYFFVDVEFANDTMIFCKLEVQGLINTKRILRCFQAMSRLKINFYYSNVQLVVKDGSRILFWEDNWMERQPLKVRFPRIYALAINKEGYIQDYGKWDEELWVWEVQLRRQPFGWEEEQWSWFKQATEEYHLSRKLEDTLAWKGAPSSQHTIESFCKLN
ncbi:Uncharacterized protein TCM_036081 [Theobroma cacao]|uniref:Uncharacterized protein n=1 Tax=Theobroma cacao TaxID=3641 RepID=A0A061FIT1_THECC|nr:Uncharacterized protein TCM_036081 [Theobroma cacao]